MRSVVVAGIGGLIIGHALWLVAISLAIETTSVSTWVLELKALRLWHSYVYATASLGLSFAFMVVVMGSLRWTRGFQDPVCLA